MHKYKHRIPTHPGLEESGQASRYEYTSEDEGQDGGFAVGNLSEMFESVQMGRIDSGSFMPGLSGSTTANSGPWTGTYTSGGSGAHGADGYVLTTAGSNTNLTVLAHIRRFVSTVLSKPLRYKMKLQQVAIVTSNLIWGVMNTQTSPFGTSPTNGVYFSTVNGAVVGNVVGGGGSVASTNTLATLAAGTVAELDFKFNNTGVASTSWGFWWVNGVMTPFTSAQITALIALTGNLVNQICVETTTGSAASVTIDAMRCEYER